jgi:hypothetical protein
MKTMQTMRMKMLEKKYTLIAVVSPTESVGEGGRSSMKRRKRKIGLSPMERVEWLKSPIECVGWSSMRVTKRLVQNEFAVEVQEQRV